MTGFLPSVPSGRVRFHASLVQRLTFLHRKYVGLVRSEKKKIVKSRDFLKQHADKNPLSRPVSLLGLQQN